MRVSNQQCVMVIDHQCSTVSSTFFFHLSSFHLHIFFHLKHSQADEEPVSTDISRRSSEVKLTHPFHPPYPDTRGQFHESKVRRKILPGRIPLNCNGFFLTFFGWLYVYSQVLQKQLLWSCTGFTPREKKRGKVSIQAPRNSTRRNFTLNFWLMILAPESISGKVS